MSARAWKWRRGRKIIRQVRHALRMKSCGECGRALSRPHKTGCLRGAKKQGRLRIEQRARERRAGVAAQPDRSDGRRQIDRQKSRGYCWTGTRFRNGVRLSKHQRGRKSRRNRRNGGEG